MTEFDFKMMEPVNKGWSEDKKYQVTKEDGTRYLLRISPIDRFETRKALFTLLQKVEKLDIPMCKPVEFGTCKDGVYALHTWIDGKDAEEVIPLLPETEQYILGLKVGEILKKIHSIPAPENQEDWYTRFNRKTNIKIQKYKECPLRFEGDEKVIAYLENNSELLKNRPQCFQHGDYHIGNMMTENGNLVIIDFDRFDFGDPWEEFNRIVWCAQASPYFASGQLNGYFGGKPPIEFFKLLAFYIASNTLSSIPWAIPFGQSDVDTMMKQAKDVLDWYDNMKNPVPKWYIDNFYYQYIDGVPCRLKSPFDFSFLQKYGKVFKIYDAQDSGNIGFGTEKDGKRYFIKFAGATTERACVSQAEAIKNLKKTEAIYRDLPHPNLIKFSDAEEIGGGFAMVFEWTDGECMGRMYPLARQKFMSMPIQSKMKVFEDVLIFHAYVAKQGYVAIDFYDGSIMYDFENEKTIICDIDFYSKAPYTNEMGRLWGSSRFMSPEEFIKGVAIDEISNVYTMGATAFALFANYDRSKENWPLSPQLYDVIIKAVCDDRNHRQQSINQLIQEWNTAII